MAHVGKDDNPNSEVDQVHAPIVRSCLECRRRKIKCDKKQPCAYCTKVRMRCIYPRPNQSARSAIADQEFDTLTKLRHLEAYVHRLEDRIVRLEGKGDAVVKDVENQSFGRELETSAPLVRQTAVNSPANADVGTWRAEHGSQVPRSNGNNDKQASHAETAPTDQAGSGLVAFPGASLRDRDRDGFVFRSFPTSDNLRHLHPQPDKIFLLWQIYLENVDPVIKIFHAPTTQAQIIDASRNMADVSPAFESLLFAIYYAAVVSVGCDDRCRDILGEERDALLQKYRISCERSLGNASFMAQPNLVSLQALTIYLVCGRRDLNENYVCSMTAAAIRIATKLGLNEDPEPEGFSPFRCEIRRRLWWMLVILEARSAEDNEQDSLIFESQFNTKFPLNINDRDMDGFMKSQPSEATGCSEMLFTNVRFEAGAAIRKITFSSKFARDNGYPVLDAQEKFDFLDSLWEHLEQKYYRHCDPSIPICFTSIAATKMVLARLKLVLYHPSRSDHLALRGEAVQTLVRTSVEIMEHMQALRSDTRYQRWVWLFQKYVEWDASAFVLLSLNVKPVASNIAKDVEMRAWKVIHTFFNTWDGRVDPTVEKKWQRLKMLRERAERRRESELPATFPNVSTGHECARMLGNIDESPIAGARASGNRLVVSQEQRQRDTAQGHNGLCTQVVGRPAETSWNEGLNGPQDLVFINPVIQELPARSGADGSQAMDTEWDSLQQALNDDEFSWPMDIDGHMLDTWL